MDLEKLTLYVPDMLSYHIVNWQIRGKSYNNKSYYLIIYYYIIIIYRLRIMNYMYSY